MRPAPAIELCQGWCHQRILADVIASLSQMMAQDGEVALLFQPLLGLAANFSGVSREPSGRSDDRGQQHAPERRCEKKALRHEVTRVIVWHVV